MALIKTLSVLSLLLLNIALSAQVNLTNGLKLYFPFSGNANDASGNGNVATVNGPVLIPDRFGAANSAYRFDGVDDFISFVNGPGMKPNYPFSFSCWMNLISPGTPNDVNFMFCNDYTIPGNDYYGTFYNIPNSIFQASVGDSGPAGPTNRNTKSFAAAAPIGSWHHYAAVVYGPNNMRLFLDCAEQNATYSGTGAGLIYSANGQGMMGRGNGGFGEYYLEADLDEVRFYDRALNDDEITALYFWPNTPPSQLFQLPTNNLNIQCGSSVNIDATFAGIISYDWSDGTQGPTKTFTTPGTYIITVDDGCLTKTDTVVVTGNLQNPQITINGPNSVCVGQPATLTVSGAQNYTWSPPTGLSATSGISVIATVNSPTTYTVIGSDACGSDTTTFTINTVSQSQASFTYTQDACTGTIIIDNTSTNASAYQWIWGDNQNSSAASPAINFDIAGEYEVTLITNPGTACADTLNTTITSSAEEQNIYIPNAFTPNGDGINEVFKLFTNKHCTTSMLYIFNCWGELIFQSHEPFIYFWNGEYVGGKKVPTGVYAYRFTTPNQPDRWGMIAVIR